MTRSERHFLSREGNETGQQVGEMQKASETRTGDGANDEK